MSKYNDGHVIEYVSQLERECFSDGWSTDSIRSSLNQSCNLLIVAYMDETTGIGDELVMQGGADAVSRLEHMWEAISSPIFMGYVIANMTDEESELLRIAVDCKKRRMKTASRLMKKYEKYVNKKTYFLEVRAQNNPARRLYEKFGYKEIGVRKNYYANPVEDAVIYSKAGICDDRI
ncbi:MAG: GNAT family N-acetyltransferase [Lachnospiraceae bacterium]|nr:GNAT family N-acetyltransferase [Lachnospiraceae bacterium]